jgi:hypothetical protein
MGFVRLSLGLKVEEMLFRSGRVMTVRELFGGLREVFAETPSGHELQQGFQSRP